MKNLCLSLLAAYTTATKIDVNFDMAEISTWFEGRMAEYEAGHMNSQAIVEDWLQGARNMTMASVEELMGVDADIRALDMQTWTEVQDYLGQMVTIDGQPLCEFFSDFSGMMEENFDEEAAAEMAPMAEVYAFDKIKLEGVPLTAMTNVSMDFKSDEIYGWFMETDGRYQDAVDSHMDRISGFGDQLRAIMGDVMGEAERFGFQMYDLDMEVHEEFVRGVFDMISVDGVPAAEAYAEVLEMSLEEGQAWIDRIYATLTDGRIPVQQDTDVAIDWTVAEVAPETIVMKVETTSSASYIVPATIGGLALFGGAAYFYKNQKAADSYSKQPLV